ncbi:MAG: hypothetical protein JST00_05550 [Deltaproteobacteria bacterium]|nr:hypothetical protein [Deltaproteobacteria bacterium]
MRHRRSIAVIASAAGLALLHLALLRAMAEGHVAHVLLGAGNAAPPLGAAALAVALVVVRFLAIVVAPGATLAALATLMASYLTGDRGERRSGARHFEEPPSSSARGRTSIEGAGVSVTAGAGTSMGGRAT